MRALAYTAVVATLGAAALLFARDAFAAVVPSGVASDDDDGGERREEFD